MGQVGLVGQVRQVGLEATVSHMSRKEVHRDSERGVAVEPRRRGLEFLADLGPHGVDVLHGAIDA